MNTTSSLPDPLTRWKQEVPVRHEGHSGHRSPALWGVPHVRPPALYSTSGTDEEACVGWVWTAVVVWVLLAVPAAVLLGRAINRAERREIGVPGPDTLVAPARPRSSAGA